MQLREFVSIGDITYRETQNAEALVRMLFRGRYDCIIIEDRAFDYHYSKLLKKKTKAPNKKYPKLIKGPLIGTDPVYIGFSEKAISNGQFPYSYQFRKSFEITIYKMNKAGDIERLMRAYEKRQN